MKKAFLTAAIVMFLSIAAFAQSSDGLITHRITHTKIKEDYREASEMGMWRSMNDGWYVVFDLKTKTYTNGSNSLKITGNCDVAAYQGCYTLSDGSFVVIDTVEISYGDTEELDLRIVDKYIGHDNTWFFMLSDVIVETRKKKARVD